MGTSDPEGMELSTVVESLMLRHRHKWLVFVERMVQDQADAEDVLQEAMLKMLSRGRRFESPDQARMYLGRIISNTAIEIYHRRRRNRRRQLQLQEQSFQSPAYSEPTLALSEGDELRAHARVLRLLNEGLALLPTKQYEALRLTVMGPEIMSIRNAGEEHDIPYSTLRHRKLQGLRRLKRYLHRALRATVAKLLIA